ncbi:MAG: cupin domain-containing protein [Chloroflexota bacterium]|nr:cupin domain-containing protein [Chloroflexota bacterium]
MSNVNWHKRTLPLSFVMLGGPKPPDDLGFTSNRIQRIWNACEEPWRDSGQHYHTESDEVFIVFKGSIELAVGDERISTEAGELCFPHRGCSMG